MMQELVVGLLLSKHDLKYLKPWLKRHDEIGQSIIIGLDGLWENDMPLDLFNCKSRVHIIQTPLNNDFAGARNKILEKSRELGYLYTLFLDADELLLPNTRNGIDLSYIIGFLEKRDTITFASLLRLNIFGRHLIDYPNYHPVIVKNSTEYINHSPELGSVPGCHEKPIGDSVIFDDLNVLHIKEVWDGNFRAKGYVDYRQNEALHDLECKIEKTK